jgi:hypothetical protein
VAPDELNMSPAESRKLKLLKRVSWQGSHSDLGTVVKSDWSGIEINWDNGVTTFVYHNDMLSIKLAKSV